MLVLVSDAPGSAPATRAGHLLRDVMGQLTVVHRSGSRWRDAVRFIAAGASMRAQTVYVVDGSAPGVLAGIALKLTLRARLVVDTGDATWALSRSTGRPALPGALLVGAVEQAAQRVADDVVVRGRYHRLHLRDRGVRQVHHIPDVADVPQHPPEPQRVADIRRRWGAGAETLVVGVVGSLRWSPRLRRCYGWDLVEALADLRDLPVTGVVVGDGDGRRHLEQRARALGVASRVVWCGRVGGAELGGTLGAMDVCLSTQTDDLVGWVRTTGKLPLYLAHERFVVASDVGEASWVLPSEMLLPYTGTVDESYPRRLAARLRQLATTHREQLQMGRVGPSIVREHFHPARRSAELLAVLGLRPGARSQDAPVTCGGRVGRDGTDPVQRAAARPPA